MNRREFLATSAALAVANAKPLPGQPEICVFSKHMAQFNWDDLGKNAKQIGFDGIDLTVRPKGHVLPENVAADLPKAVEAIRKHGLSVPMITTELKDASDPAARPTFEAMKKLDIKLYKPGYWRYGNPLTVDQTLEQTKKSFASLLALGKEYGVTMGVHNHSGAYVGSAVWDTREIIAGTDPKDAGYYFDPGHATTEGGLYGWRLSMDVVAPRLKMVAVKDFYWEKKEGKWKQTWCPLGEGMVNWLQVFAQFSRHGYSGPVSLHSEYPGGEDLTAIAKDLAFIKRQILTTYPRKLRDLE